MNDNQKKEKDVLQDLDGIDKDISQTANDLERIDGELFTLKNQ